MPDAVILLPPSEGKAEGGRRRGRRRVPGSFPRLDGPRGEVADALVAAMDDPGTARKVLGVKGAALEAAMAANRSLADGPVLPAIERYTGVLYDHLGAATFGEDTRDRLAREVLIISGLWGVVRARDPLPDYKLKIDAALPGLGRLATWWRPHVTPVLDRAVRGAVVWDLLPNAHAAVWADPDRTPALRVTTSFEVEQHRDGERVRSTVTHWSKALKGTLARHLLTNPVPEASVDGVAHVLRSLRHEQGYALESLSGDGTHLHATFLGPATP
jgi:uncharacterized protein